MTVVVNGKKEEVSIIGLELTPMELGMIMNGSVDLIQDENVTSSLICSMIQRYCEKYNEDPREICEMFGYFINMVMLFDVDKK